jgi:hypothetical protein
MDVQVLRAVRMRAGDSAAWSVRSSDSSFLFDRLGMERLGPAIFARRIPRAGPRESILTACGERVGLMTRAAASQIKPGAAHSPPPFPTVLTLEPALPHENMNILFQDQSQNPGRRSSSGDDCSMEINHIEPSLD